MSNKLDYLTKDEILNLYELFFGNILIKKKDFDYYSNLVKSLSNENSIAAVIEKLDENELMILKKLSDYRLIPISFINEKLTILLKIQTHIINKALTNLINKKYIFQRDNLMIIPNIYFEEKRNKINYSTLENKIDFPNKFISELNNIINFFISKQVGFSSQYLLYKKDLRLLMDSFSKHVDLSEEEFNIFSYFFTIAFKNDDYINIALIKEYFSLKLENKILFFLKIAFPYLLPVYSFCLRIKASVKITHEEIEGFLSNQFIMTEYNYLPYNFTFENTINFLEKNNLVKLQEGDVIFPCLIYENTISKDDEIRLSSSFNFYINANSTRSDFYYPSLFSDFIKYEKMVEYEISENSIKKAVSYGITVDDVFEYFSNININVSKNVETTIKQWFEKHGSYFFARGIIFYCQTGEKGKFINSLIKKGLIKAFEIKANEIFIIPEEEQDNFFKFLENSGINYCEKKPFNNLKKIDSIVSDTTIVSDILVSGE